MKIRALASITALTVLLPLQASAKEIDLACAAPTGTLYVKIDTDQQTMTLGTAVQNGIWMPLHNVSVQEHVITATLTNPINGKPVDFNYSLDRTNGMMTITTPVLPSMKKQATCAVTALPQNRF